MKQLPIDKINAMYRKLKCPPGVMDPSKFPLKRDKYFVLVSERSVGKTTNILLWGMCAHEICGTQIQYIRQHTEMITPKISRQLFDTILQFGYIDRITKGKYNDVRYYAAGWRYVKRGDNGEIIDEDTKPFMMCLGINRNEYYKSSYNAPTGDVIIFDEFVARYTPQDEFVYFCDLVKTIIRERTAPLVFMLGNTLDRYNTYFAEMELLDITTTMPLGQSTETTTKKGTPIYVEFVTREKTPEKLNLNKIFFGFKNKKLGSITGEGWALTPMQHIDPEDDERDVLIRSLYVTIEDQLINLELCHSATYGTHVICHAANKVYPDSRIYTLSLMIDWRYRYKFGHDKLDKLIWTLYERKKFYYATNSIGVLIDKYAEAAKVRRSLY